MERPFPQEEELKSKTDRLNELNALLNVDKRENEIVGGEPDEGEELPEKKPKDLERWLMRYGNDLILPTHSRLVFKRNQAAISILKEVFVMNETDYKIMYNNLRKLKKA